MVATVAVTWFVATLVALWLLRVAVEVRRWYWQREVERLSPPPPAAPRSHVRSRRPPFDWDAPDSV